MQLRKVGRKYRDQDDKVRQELQNDSAKKLQAAQEQLLQQEEQLKQKELQQKSSALQKENAGRTFWCVCGNPTCSRTFMTFYCLLHNFLLGLKS